MKEYRVGILGATGAVGREMMKVLAERKFPISELRPLASVRSVGKKISFEGTEVSVQEATENAFDGLDIVLGAAQNAIAKQFAPAIKAAGAVFVDNSSAFRLNPDVPLVVPEINPEDVALHHHYFTGCDKWAAESQPDREHYSVFLSGSKRSRSSRAH